MLSIGRAIERSVHHHREIQMNPTAVQDAEPAAEAWRPRPGYVSAAGSEFESIHILLGRFLADRHSPDPLEEPSLLGDNPTFEWGMGQPLEKVVDSRAAFDQLLMNPQLFRNSIAIIEPREHVGYNPWVSTCGPR